MLKFFAAACTLAATLVFFTACSDSDPAAAANAPQSFVIALEPDKDPDAMLADRAALAAFLETSTNREAEVIIPISAVVIREGLLNGTIDAAYVSGTAAARLMRDNAVDILLATEINGNTFYESYWVARKDAPYQSVHDLRGQPIAFASRTSTSGFLVPLWDLHSQNLIPAGAGPEAFFGAGNVHFGVGYVSAIERVLDGSAQAAAVSYYVLDEDKHLSAAQRAQLRAIDRQGPVPTHVIVVRANLHPDARAALRAALQSLNSTDTALRDRLFNATLVEVDPQQHLASIREALAFAEALPQ